MFKKIITQKTYDRILRDIHSAFNGHNCSRNCRGDNGRCVVSEESQEFAINHAMSMVEKQYIVDKSNTVEEDII